MPVPPGNSFVSLTCSFGGAAGAVMVGWPGAAQDRLPADALVVQPGRPGVQRGPGEERRLLALRHENAALRRNAGRVQYDPADRAWFAALTRFIPRRHWAEVFPVTPATLLAWHRRLAARKYDTSKRRRPGRPRRPGASPGSPSAWRTKPTVGLPGVFMASCQARRTPVPADRPACRKWTARIPAAWACRNCRQVGPLRRGAGSIPAARRIS